MTRRLWTVASVLVVIGWAGLAGAAISVAPNAVSVYPSQTSPAITVSLQFEWCEGGTVVLDFAGLPAGASTVPSPVTYEVDDVACTGLVSFRLAASPSTPSGVYPITITDPPIQGVKPSGGQAVVTLTVLTPSFDALVSPSTVLLTAGGGSASVTVSTTTDPGFAEPGLVYGFESLPAFIDTGGPQTAAAPGYPPVVFTLTAAAGATPGTYPGVLRAATLSQVTLKTFPISVVVEAAPPPVIGTVLPPEIERGASGLAVTIQGSGFHDGAVVEVDGVGVAFSEVEVVSANLIRLMASATPDAPLGPRSVTVQNPDGQRSNPGTLTVVLPPPPVIASLTPATIERATAALELTIQGSGFVAGAAVTIDGSGVDLRDIEVLSAALIRCTASAALDTPLGPRSVTVRNPDGQRSNPGTLTVVPPPAPSLAAVLPSSLRQDTPAVQLTLQGAHFLTGATVAVGGTGVSLSGVVVLSPNEIVAVAAVEPEAAPGVRSVTVENPDGQRSNPVPLTVTPKPPTVTAITPPAVSTARRSVVLQVSGDTFRPGAAASTTAAGITVESTERVSSSLLRVTISLRPEAATGAVALAVRNPDGGVSMPPGTLLVYPDDAMGAPLGVTTAAIVFPRPGALIGPREDVFPRGLLATTGTGTLVAVWRLDGVPFDRVTAATAGGLPVEVASNVPIPASFVGDHLLELAVEQPESEAVAALTVTRTEEWASGLRLWAPGDRQVIGRRGTPFRWSVVPGAELYELEVEGAQPWWPFRVRTARTEWTPGRNELDAIGAGVRRWTVRPLFPGEVEGAPSDEREAVFLPPSVELGPVATGLDEPTSRLRASWTGGAQGLLYRLEVLAPEDDTVLFSALTAAPDYLVPSFVELPAGARFRVSGLGPEGEVYGVSAAARGGPENGAAAWAEGFALAQAEPQVEGVTPPDGAVVETDQPRIAARWLGEVDPLQVALLVDGTDVTQVSVRRPGSVRYDCLLPLGPGRHLVQLRLASHETGWSFEVRAPEGAVPPKPAPAPGAEPAAPAEAAPRREARSDWRLGLQGTVTLVDEEVDSQSDAVLAQLSGQADLAAGELTLQGAGDVSVRHDLEEPTRTVQQSRNWLVKAGAEQSGGRVREQLAVGFSPPSFTAGSQLVSTGLARGGVEGTLTTSIGSASVYRTFSSRPAGIVSGSGGLEQTVTGWALTSPASWQRVEIRVVGLEVEDQPNQSTSGGEGEILGVFGRITIAPLLTLFFEGADGEFTPNPGSVEGPRSGRAFRLGLSGVSGTFGYTLNLRRTDADFVNPANRGLTVGGVSDREGGDLQLQKSFGRTFLTGSVRYLRGGTTSGSTNPSTEEKGGMLQLSTVLGSSFSLTVGTNFSDVSGDADPERLLPATDVSMWGVNASLSERFGRFGLVQSLFYQEMENGAFPAADQETTSLNLSANGPLTPDLMLIGLLSGTRTEGAPEVGTTDSLLTSLQPVWTPSGIGLTLQPRLTWGRTENDRTGLETTTEQYQLLVGWRPPRIGSWLQLQVSGDWSRSRVAGLDDPGFRRRLALVLNLTWGAGSARASTALPPADFGPAPGLRPTGVPIAMMLDPVPQLGWR